MVSFIRRNIQIIIILLLAILLRFIWLDRIPAGLSDDELIYSLTAKSMYLSGKGISGVWPPSQVPLGVAQYPHSEIPYLLSIPVIGPLPFSLFNARLPYAVVSVASVLLLYLIVKQAMNTKTALITALVAAGNPWSIFFGRTTFEAPVAIFFLLVSFYFIQRFKKHFILLTVIPLSLAFYSYMGIKLMIVPFTIIISLYGWLAVHKRKFAKYYIAIVIFAGILLLHFILTVGHQSMGARLSEVWTPANPVVTSLVNDQRRMSIVNPLANVLSNKYTVFFRESVNKYIKIFSADFLFVNGESRNTFSMYYHGYFYYLDLLFLLAGIVFLFMKYSSFGFALVALAMIAPIPAIANYSSTGFGALRAALLFPVLIIIISSGIRCVLDIKKYQGLIISVLLLAYSGLAINFFSIYYYQYSIYSSEAYSLSSLVLSKYILLYDAKQPIYVYSGSPADRYKFYLFYANLFNKSSVTNIQQSFQTKQYVYNNVHFLDCKETYTQKDDTVLIVESGVCDKLITNTPASHLSISQLSDAGTIYNIYNDTQCRNWSTKRYPENISMQSLLIMKLDVPKFCNTFIMNRNESE